MVNGNPHSGILVVDRPRMHDEAESGIRPSEADPRSAHCDQRACSLTWCSWQRTIWNLFNGPSESKSAAEDNKDLLAAKVDHRSLVEKGTPGSDVDDSSVAALGASSHRCWSEEARVSPRISDERRPSSVPTSLRMERNYFGAEKCIYVPAILSDNFKENKKTENVRAAPLTSRPSLNLTELYRDIPRNPSANVSENSRKDLVADFFGCIHVSENSREDLGADVCITSARALSPSASPDLAMHKKQSPGTVVALGEPTLEQDTPVQTLLLGNPVRAECLLAAEPFWSDVESTFTVDLTDLSKADVGCTLQIASVQSALPLLSAVIPSENRMDIHLPGVESGVPRCSVEASTQTGQPSIISDLHGRPFAKLQAYNAGSAEVTVNGTTVMIAYPSQGIEFVVKSPEGKPIGISRVQSDAMRGDHLEIRCLPGTDNLLVLVVILTLTLFCQTT